MNTEKGVGCLQRLALAINLDLHQRLRNALSRCMDELEDEDYIGVELQWLGGDDLMIRCFPRFLKHFESAFSEDMGYPHLKYSFACAQCKPEQADLLKAMKAVKDKVKEVKAGKTG